MAQLDFCSYSEQYFLVAVTFWFFYFNALTAFIIPFVQIMKMRKLIINSNHGDEEILNSVLLGTGKMPTNKNPRFFL